MESPPVLERLKGWGVSDSRSAAKVELGHILVFSRIKWSLFEKRRPESVESQIKITEPPPDYNFTNDGFEDVSV